MRRSSAPSSGNLNKKGRFSTPFASKPVIVNDNTGSVKSVPIQRSAAAASAGDAPSGERPRDSRRPLTEVLKILDQQCADNSTSSALHQPARQVLTARENCQEGAKDVPLDTGHTQSSLRIPESNGGAAAENQSHAQVESSDGARYFDVLWCKKSGRKHKKWEGDAVLEVHRRHVILREPSDGSVLGQGMGYKVAELEDLCEGSLLSVGSREIEVQSQVSPAEYRSRTAQPTQAAPQTDAQKTAPPPPRPPAARQFVSPLVGAAPRRPGGGPVQPRFDPRAPGALVMPRPSAEYQWKHNSGGVPVVDVVVDPHLSRRLRPHQRQGVSFLYSCLTGLRSENWRGAVLADEMGLGKTLQCITLIWTMLKQGPFAGEPIIRRVLIVTPSSLVNNWAKEFAKWLGRERLSVFCVNQSHTVAEFASGRLSPVLVVSYEMAARSVEALRRCQFDLLVCDEGHRLKSGESKTAAALEALGCRRRLLLTGTPVQNHLLELFALLNFVNPGALGSAPAFRREYERPVVEGQQPGASEEVRRLGQERAAQLATVTDRFILRRTQDILEKYLPPKIEMVVFCRPSPLQEELYSRILESRAVRQLLSSESAADAGSVHLVYISLLRKLCSHPSLLLPGPQQQESEAVRSLELRDVLPSDGAVLAEHSGKLTVLSHLLLALRASDSHQKIVLISYHRQTLDILASLCQQLQLSFLRLDGTLPAGRRQALVDQFNSNFSGERVFLLSAKAGGVGLNLAGASSVVLYDLDWNPASDLQALARVWRDGQRRTTRVYRLLTAGTVEEKVYQRQVSKQSLSAAVVEAAPPPAAAHFTAAELRDLFTLDAAAESSTHRLLSCDCDGAGGGGSAPVQEHEERRACQLAGGAETAPGGQRTGMERLMEWEHYRTPLDPNVIQDEGLLSAGEHISFLFRNVVSASFQ